MNKNLGKHLGQVEIADLIEESVANAALRREDSLVDVTEEEAKNIEGGISIYSVAVDPKTIKPICCYPPIMMGMIIEAPTLKL